MEEILEFLNDNIQMVYVVILSIILLLFENDIVGKELLNTTHRPFTALKYVITRILLNGVHVGALWPK